MKKFNLAIVGATGLVGSTFIKVLSEKNLPISNIYLYASKKSAGKKLKVLGKDIKVSKLRCSITPLYSCNVSWGFVAPINTK